MCMETGAELLMANNGASVSICGAHSTLLHAARNKNGQMTHDSWLLLFLGFEPTVFQLVGQRLGHLGNSKHLSINLKFMSTNCQFRQIKDKLILP